jgi:hypothetical protein
MANEMNIYKERDMGKRIVELETCTVVFPEWFDANQWSYDAWVAKRQRDISRTAKDAPSGRKVKPQETEKLPQNS